MVYGAGKLIEATVTATATATATKTAKSNRFRLAKQQFCTCIPLFCTFLCHRCTPKAWNFLFSRFVEDVSTKQQFSFPFPELRYSPWEINSRKIRHYKLCRIEWDGINATNLKAAQIHFLSSVFVTVAVAVVYNRDLKIRRRRRQRERQKSNRFNN